MSSNQAEESQIELCTHITALSLCGDKKGCIIGFCSPKRGPLLAPNPQTCLYSGALLVGHHMRAPCLAPCLVLRVPQVSHAALLAHLLVVVWLTGLPCSRWFVLQVEGEEPRRGEGEERGSPEAVCGKVLTVQVVAISSLPQCEHFFHMQPRCCAHG